MNMPIVAVVNHDATFLDMMHEVLVMEGYEAVCLHVDDHAFAKVQEAHPALAIIDIAVHQRDAAWALVQQIHTDPTTADIPVIVCTADIAFVRGQGGHPRGVWLRGHRETV